MKRGATPPRRKVVFVGDYGVGKSSLLMYMATGEFDNGPFRRIIYDFRMTELMINGRLLELELWNTAPQEDYDRLRPLTYPHAAVVVLAFAIDDPKSFQNITERWQPEIVHFCSTPKVPTILVGCKSDLRERENQLFSGAGHPNYITTDQGRTLATQIGALTYLECSPRSNSGIAEVMKFIGKTAISWDPRAEPRSKKTCQIV